MFKIVSIRTELAPSGDHHHILTVGFHSVHMPNEPVFIPVERVIDRIALGEAFVVEHEGENVPVVAGKCHECGHEPYLKTEKDPAGGSLLLSLPRG